MRALVVLALLAACGGDDADSSCAPVGFASGEADVLGAPLGPFARAALIITPPGSSGSQLAIVLDETDGACGEPGASGRRLVLALCATPAPGDFEVLTGGTLRCSTADGPTQASALLEDFTGADLGGATGTLHVDHAGGCVSGSYELMFGGALLSGDFDAVICAS